MTVRWRCGCRSLNYLHWEICFDCGAPQPPPPEPPKPKNDLKSIEQTANKGQPDPVD